MRLLLLLLATTISSFAWSTGLELYQATYKAKFNGLDITATHQLEQIKPGYYRETLKARNFLGKIDEEARFHVDAQQRVAPSEYTYERSLLGVSRSESQVFDWDKNQLTFTKDDETNIVPIEKGYQDMISHKVQMRRDLAAGEQKLDYQVVSRGKLKNYTYEVTGEELLNTAVGDLHTVRLERVREDSDRSTILWLAKDWNYLLVKLEQVEDGDSHLLQLTDASVGGQPVLGAAH